MCSSLILGEPLNHTFGIPITISACNIKHKTVHSEQLFIRLTDSSHMKKTNIRKKKGEFISFPKCTLTEPIHYPDGVKRKLIRNSCIQTQRILLYVFKLFVFKSWQSIQSLWFLVSYLNIKSLNFLDFNVAAAADGHHHMCVPSKNKWQIPSTATKTSSCFHWWPKYATGKGNSEMHYFIGNFLILDNILLCLSWTGELLTW